MPCNSFYLNWLGSDWLRLAFLALGWWGLSSFQDVCSIDSSLYRPREPTFAALFLPPYCFLGRGVAEQWSLQQGATKAWYTPSQGMSWIKQTDARKSPWEWGQLKIRVILCINIFWILPAYSWRDCLSHGIHHCNTWSQMVSYWKENTGYVTNNTLQNVSV